MTAIMVFAAVVLGGMSNMKGAMVGTAVIVFLPEAFRAFDTARFLILGAILVLVMIVRPAGLFPLRPRRYRLPDADPSRLFPPADKRGAPGRAILQCSGLTRRFGGLTATDDVTFSVPEGAILALIGPNGAGKSTLFNLIGGGLRADAGGVSFAGEPLLRRKPHENANLGIARTFQLIRLFSAATVVENVAVGADLRHRQNVLTVGLGLPAAKRVERAALADAASALEFCGIAHLAHSVTGELSYGDQRRVEIARALASRPRLLLLDEPAAGMNQTERQGLAALIRKIGNSGVTIVLVEHDIELVMGLSHEVLVLDRGQIIAYRPPDEVRRNPRVIEAYLGRCAGRDKEAHPSSPALARQSAGPGLSVRDLKVRYGPIEAVHGIDFDVAPGELVALIGANGAGKSSTLLAISGVLRASAAAMTYGDQDIRQWPAHRIAPAGIAHVPEGRRIFPGMSVWENLVMGAYSRRAVPAGADLDRIFELFPILKARLRQAGGTLLGGEQQMLAMARALTAQPKLLLLDEPSMGLSPQMVDRIFDVISSVSRSGTSVLLVEQNAEMALAIADRAYVLESGRIQLFGDALSLLHDAAVQAAYLGGR